MKSDRWFFFGDHQQLPPVSLLHQENPAEASVFSQLVRHKKPTLLSTTYRLNAPLAHWPSEQFYHGELRSAVPHHRLALKQSSERYSDLLAPADSLVRMVVDSPGCRSRNDEEADHVAQIVYELLTSGICPGEIGVVTPFRAQASRIRTLLRGDRFKLPFPNIWKSITVDTVERFQGQEREVILYSFASSDPAFIRKLGNFLFQPARLNVAVTRARTKVILLHSQDLADYAKKLPYGSEAAAVFISLLDEAVVIPTPTPTRGPTLS
jgi:DNA replication ATP-dependent helicase Dna2